MALSIVTNEDCMAMMSRYPDKFFDLAVVDPPYGIGQDGSKNETRVGKAKAKKYKPFSGNDKEPPPQSYFNELFRVSKNQVIWGANYFTDKLPPSMGWIFWFKDAGSVGFSDGELAFTSFQKALRTYKYTWNGFRQGPTCQSIENRIHPTQKPVALYDWIFKNYAKPGDKILDTHLGSASSRIAANKAGLDFYGCELDKDYFEAQEKRYVEFVSQLRMF